MYKLALLWFCTVFADWQSEQIQDDLAAFPKLSRSNISKTLDKLGPRAETAHIVIQGGQVFLKRLETKGDRGVDFRLGEVLIALRRWQKSAHTRPSRKLPDTEFLLSLGDGLDIDPQSQLASPASLGVPVFVFCKRQSSRSLALFPDPGALMGRRRTKNAIWRGDFAFPWSRKKEILFWRGAGSDGEYNEKNWRSFPRSKLVLLALEKPDLVDAKFTALPHMCSQAALNKVVESTGKIAPFVSPQEHIAFKYLMDIDGLTNGWDRCFWGLLSSSVLFKQKSPFCQWYYKALEPDRHYIQVERDLSDLEEKVAWAKDHDSFALAISKEATKLAKGIFARSAVFGYIQALLQEYNRRFED